MPARLAFSPDGRLLTYLWSEDESLVRALWVFDVVNGERRVLAHPPGSGTTDANANPITIAIADAESHALTIADTDTRRSRISGD